MSALIVVLKKMDVRKQIETSENIDFFPSFSKFLYFNSTSIY